MSTEICDIGKHEWIYDKGTCFCKKCTAYHTSCSINETIFTGSHKSENDNVVRIVDVGQTIEIVKGDI